MAENDKDEIAELEARLAALKAKESGPAEAVDTPEVAKPEVKAADNKRGCLIGVVIIVGLIALVSFCSNSSPTTTAPQVAETDNPLTSGPTTPAEPPSPWNYSEAKDPMSDHIDHTACVTSTNQVQLSWPYSPVTAQMCVRQTQRWGMDIYIALNGDGQMLCTSYDGCRVNVRFDEAEARPVRATGADDNSSNIIFISDGSTSSFLQRLKAASTTKVAINYYQAGNQVLEFPTAGLEWPRPPADG